MYLTIGDSRRCTSGGQGNGALSRSTHPKPHSSKSPLGCSRCLTGATHGNALPLSGRPLLQHLNVMFSVSCIRHLNDCVSEMMEPELIIEYDMRLKPIGAK